ncbi:class I SAM-dependent methyltransferase [Nonomuraea guangzhouensis]|uniref:Class I SAM-dependent methyltransferase n=1 Tax=Nonomuraea guangzhouensis TaxID=1291555 RepID=A0ABW4GTD0_9ACTN|nr:methyltransferase domain-containing protein [Nonomuraea guangzhouensis]
MMGFSAGEKRWRERLGSLRDVVRQELVSRQLAAHLPPAPARVLDVGCGQGTQALRAAAQGHRVTALDASGDLLGLLSLLVRNGDALAMRAGQMGDWAAARAAFDGNRYTNRLGVVARADGLADLTRRLAVQELGVLEWYGVRVFTDLAADDAPLPDDLDLLLECEERAGASEPYRRVAPLVHVIAQAGPAK